MTGLAAAHLSALELAPAAFARAAHSAGFAKVGLRLHPAAPGAVAYLPAGRTALAELRRKLDAEGVAVHDVEFVPIGPDFDPAACEPLLEAGAALGAAALNVSGDDPERGRLVERFAALCERAQGHGLRVELEFMRWRAVGRLHDALAVVAAAGQTNGRVLLDALHLFRSGGTPAAVSAADRRWIGSVQLCDAGAEAPADEAAVIAEARGGRLPPGEGALDLAGLLAALGGAGGPYGVELPMEGVPAADRLARGYAGARALLVRHGAWEEEG